MARYRTRYAVLALAVLLLPRPLPAQKFEGSPPAAAGDSKFGAPPLWPSAAATRPQTAPAPAPAPAPEDLRTEQTDPPARVGRLARVSGAASLRLPGEADWQPARRNEAVIAGHALWTEPGGRAALEFGESRLFADSATSIAIATLDESSLRASLAQGSVFLVLRGLAEANEIVEVVMPQAVVSSALDGRILIEAGGDAASGQPARVAVFEGSAVLTVGDQEITLAAGEALRLPEGEPPVRESAGAGTPLVAWAGGTAPRPRIPPSAAQAVRGMTGAADLGGYGRWEGSTEYGDVWYPQAVAADWVPYSDGAWRWQEPWGWTWVDAAPWGFATSHYGRWVQSGRRWGWAPAPIRVVGFARPRPVWAPALVVFFGAGPGVGRPGAWRPGLGSRQDRPAVGWVPLGPREAWYPGYRASAGYVQRANLFQVRDLTMVRNTWAERGREAGVGSRRDGPGALPAQRLEGFANRRAASVMTPEAMLASRDVRRDAQRLAPGAAARAELLAAPPARPAGGQQAGPRVPGPPAGRVALAPDGRREPARDDSREAPGQGVTPRGGEPRRAPADTAARQQELLQRQQADRERRQGERGPVQRDPVARQQELRQGQGAGQAPRQQEEQGQREEQRQRVDQARRQQDQQQRQQSDEARRQQEDQGRRQQEQQQRQQADQARRQQEDQGRRQQEQQQRQQADQARRQQEDQGRRQQEQQQRQQADQARRQQEDQGRRQQEQQQRQQADQARRQQEDQGRRQQEQQQRQQADQARRQQEDQGRRQQEQQQRQQADQARRQQEDQGRRQQEQQQRQQEQRQQERAQRQR